MGEKKEYIERGALIRLFDERYITAIVQQKHDDVPEDHKKHWKGVQSGTNWCKNTVLEAPAADVVEVEKVAEMLRAMFDDDCACNYNGNDEWLPHVCEYGCTECPDAPEDTGCWKQFVKHFLAKMDGERKEQT